MTNLAFPSYAFLSQERARQMYPPGEISDDRQSEVTFNSSGFPPRFGSQLYARHAVDIFLASNGACRLF
jgi:hypothetical protein